MVNNSGQLAWTRWRLEIWFYHTLAKIFFDGIARKPSPARNLANWHFVT